MEPKFEVGRVVVTKTFIDSFHDPMVAHLEARRAISRHQSGDWGELCKEDWQTNEQALSDEGRLVSSYSTGEDLRYMVITEWHRAHTTVLLFEDY